MSYLEDHLKTCDYCRQKQKGASSLKPTIYIKSKSDYYRQMKLAEFSSVIKGTSAGLETSLQTKGASSNNIWKKPGPIEREIKLKALGKMVRGR